MAFRHQPRMTRTSGGATIVAAVISLALLAFLTLAGERVRFDVDCLPAYSQRQLALASDATRQGLTRFAMTAEGQRLIARFDSAEYDVLIVEDGSDGVPGRAPQPGLRTMLAAHDPGVVKLYTVILNPDLANLYRHHNTLNLGEPMTPVDVMAAAWAAEMLHLDFYADGIPLPHHDRRAFRERWHAVANQLGFPRLRHESE